MDEEQKKQIAVFRFGVIADFVTGNRLPRGDRRRLLSQKCARKWNIPFSHRTRIGRSTVCDWIARYESSGGQLEALYPKDRADRCPKPLWRRLSRPWENGVCSAHRPD